MFLIKKYWNLNYDKYIFVTIEILIIFFVRKCKRGNRQRSKGVKEDFSVNVQINFNTCIYYDPYKSTKEGSGKFKLNETTTNPERTALSSMNTGGVTHI